MILRARTVLPVSDRQLTTARSGFPPIASAPSRRGRSCGRTADEKILDLGEVILLPGLVNAHCHLDYTDMAGQLPPPKKFTDWIASITAAKTAWSYSDYARSWLRGAHMLLKSGTTTVADIEAMPDLLPEVWDATPLRVFSFFEMTGIRARRIRRKSCAKPSPKLIRSRTCAAAPCSRRTRRIPLCRNCSSSPPRSPAKKNGASARTSPSPFRNLTCSAAPRRNARLAQTQ